MALAVGDKVPDFKLRMGGSKGREWFQFRERVGLGGVVLVFYPLAFTGTCTEELCNARDSMRAFEDVGATVFGFSTDTVYANEQFAKTLGLQYPLVSDPNREVVERIWETQTVVGIERVAKRGVMIVDARGIVKWQWRTDDPAEWPGLAETKAHLEPTPR